MRLYRGDTQDASWNNAVIKNMSKLAASLTAFRFITRAHRGAEVDYKEINMEKAFGLLVRQQNSICAQRDQVQ